MLKSMTGFSYKKENVKNIGEISVAMRSYNNRFLDINIKTSRGMEHMEKCIFESVSNLVDRGRIDVFFGFVPEKAKEQLETEALKKANKKLNAYKKELSIKGEINFSTILNYAQEHEYSTKNIKLKDLEKASVLVLKKATAELMAYKVKQGSSIKKDLNGILNRLTKMNKSFEEFLKENVKDIETISKDVFEEFSLISFYIEQLRKILFGKDNAIGKKLDFLSQELLREVNTLQSKIKDKKISLQAIYFKEEIERIREISNNVE